MFQIISSEPQGNYRNNIALSGTQRYSFQSALDGSNVTLIAKSLNSQSNATSSGLRYVRNEQQIAKLTSALETAIKVYLHGSC